MPKYKCSICEYAFNDSDAMWENLPKAWNCPVCSASKKMFDQQDDTIKTLPVKIIDIFEETHDVKTFRLEKPKDFSFLPGQYCFLINGDEKRPFTFSSSPNKEYLELTIKLMGEFTHALFKLKPGKKLLIEGPMGKNLVFNENIKQDIVFLSGGSGITPFMGILRYALEKKAKNHFFMLYGSMTEEDIIFKKELQNMSISLFNFIANPKEDWKGEKGHITVEKVIKYVPNPKEKLWYICGPPAMNKAMRIILKEVEIEEKDIRMEEWELPGKN